MTCLRIGMLSGAWPPMPCGIGDYAAGLTEALRRRGDVEVGVLTQGPASSAKGDGVPSSWRVPGWRAGQALPGLRVMLQWQPDVIHLHYPSIAFGRRLFPNTLGLRLRLTRRVPLVVTLHEYFSASRAGRGRALLTAVGSRHVLTVEERVARHLNALRALLPFGAATAVHVPSNIPTDTSPAAALLDARRTVLGDQADQPLVAFFGLITPAKGLDVLLPALQTPGLSSAHLLCIGPFGERPAGYAAAVRDLVKRLGLAPRVHFAGYVSDPARVATLLAAADVCAFPFTHGVTERNTSVLAALAQRVHVVTTHGPTGWRVPGLHLVPPGDATALATVVGDLLARGRPAAPALPGDWDAHAGQVLEIYRQVRRGGDHARGYLSPTGS